MRIGSAKGGASNFILAFPQNAAAEGGTVLMLDASIKEVSGADFTKLFEAQKSESPNAMRSYLQRDSAAAAAKP